MGDETVADDWTPLRSSAQACAFAHYFFQPRSTREAEPFELVADSHHYTTLIMYLASDRDAGQYPPASTRGVGK